MMVKTLIEDGDNVIFKKEDSSRIYQIRKRRMVHFSRAKISVDELIGQPYGSTFELDRGKLTRVKEQSIDVNVEACSLDQSADNRNLVDADSNQKMSKDDIMKMKDEGMTGEKIIEELVENSETFKTKTEFSKAKYLKKKKKKHMQTFTVHEPTARLVMEMYAKEPGKMNFLRPDSLSQLLCFSNVMYGSRVAVMESSQGMVVASLLQRLGGAGTLIQLIPNNQNPPTRNIVDYFSFPKEHLDNLYTFPLDQLSTLNSSNKDGEEDKTDQSPDQPSAVTVPGSASGEKESQRPCPVASTDVTDSSKQTDNVPTSDAGDNEMEEKSEDGVKEIAQIGTDSQIGAEKENGSHNDAAECSDVLETEKAEEMECDPSEVTDKTEGQSVATVNADGAKPFVKNRELQRIARAKRIKEAGDIIRQKQLDSLVIACKQNPVPVMTRMLKFLGPSRSVVVYSQYIDPLIECYTYVKEQHVGLQLRLTDTWLREYQVLPQRTHPKVSMSGTGGYLLTFITTEPSAFH